VQPSWSEGGTTRRNFGKGPFNDYFIKVWFQLSNWFQKRIFLCEFPIGSLPTKMATKLKIEKRQDEILKESSLLKLLSQSQPNFAEPSNDYFIKILFLLSYWFQTRWILCEFPIGSYVKLSTAVQPSWSEGGTTRRNFGKGPFNDYFFDQDGPHSRT
jgi:hypothetical protein